MRAGEAMIYLPVVCSMDNGWYIWHPHHSTSVHTSLSRSHDGFSGQLLLTAVPLSHGSMETWLQNV
jgi:hypothetical protein